MQDYALTHQIRPRAKLFPVTERAYLLRKADEILNSNVDGLYRLQDAILELDGFDFVIIDTAPSMNSLLYNALIAADEVIIPITADRYGLQGLSQLNDTLIQLGKDKIKT